MQKTFGINENVKIVNGEKTRSLGNTFISLFPNLPIWTHKKERPEKRCLFLLSFY